jgi:CheY-like chemotaxis protein
LMRQKDLQDLSIQEQPVKKKIAIVDDEDGVVSILSILVRKLGYSPDFVASDGKEIVQAVLNRSISPDLIIMDYRMPVMSGIEAAKIILKEYPLSKIIIESADDGVRQSVLDEGMLFLQKPFSKEDLRNVINQAFSISN